MKPRELQYIKLKDATFADPIIPQINNGPTMTNSIISNTFPTFPSVSIPNSISLTNHKPLPFHTIPFSLPHPSNLIPSTIPLPPHPPTHIQPTANRRVDTGRHFTQIPRYIFNINIHYKECGLR